VKKEGNPSKQNKTQERLLPIYEKFGRVSIYIYIYIMELYKNQRVRNTTINVP
jgi:hypothetical protein